MESEKGKCPAGSRCQQQICFGDCIQLKMVFQWAEGQGFLQDSAGNSKWRSRIAADSSTRKEEIVIAKRQSLNGKNSLTENGEGSWSIGIAVFTEDYLDGRDVDFDGFGRR